MILCGCSVAKTYENVDASEITPQTLWRGQKIVLEYLNGRVADITVAEVTQGHIVAQDGSEWPKVGIERLTVENPKPLSDSDPLGAIECLFTAPNCSP